jgi:nucleotide-binding universal stress UspA family protein
MFKSIMIPVDLENPESADGSVRFAAERLAGDDVKLTLVGVTGSAPSAAAHNPAEFKENLEALATRLSALHGVAIEAKAMHDNDVATHLGAALVDTSIQLEADLIVMTSHVPGVIEHVFSSNAGYVASHAKCSVVVLR